MKISNVKNIIAKNLECTKPLIETTNNGLAENAIKELSSHKAVNLSSRVPTFALINVHKSKGGTIAYNYLPDNYKKLVSRELIPAKPERFVEFGGRKYKQKATPAYYQETYETLPSYHIDKLWSKGKGTGTRSIQDVVRKSLADIETQGRVTLEACCIDDISAPGGFYYKLGFRFSDSEMNNLCEQWLKNGGKREDAPFAIGQMFLPKENISHCLNYGKV